MEVKKTGKGLKVLVGILTALLVAVIGYIVVDKFILNKTENNTTNNVVNKESGKLSDDEIQNLYQTLIVGDKQYGFYYEEKINIDNITENQIMPYALLRFLESKGWLNSLKTDLQCVLYPEETINQCGGSEIPKAQKSEIDSLIKNVFNTTKTYTVEEKEPKFLGKNATSYVYMNNMYYFGYVPSSGFNRQIYSKFVKSEQDENNVYIYDKAFIHDSDGSGGNAVYLSIGGTYIIGGAASDISDYYSNGKLDSEKVYNDFDSKLNTFKHTFKKAEDGKYYWYSSEIVEQAKTTTTDINKNSNTNNNQSSNTNTNSESVITTNKFDLSKISCTNQTTSTCTKTVKVGLNGANHTIKIESIEQSVAGQTNTEGRKWSDVAVKLVHKIYLDGKYIRTIDDGNVYDAESFGNKPDNTKLNIHGYVYVFDKQYFATVLPYYVGEKLQRNANFFTSTGGHIGKLIMDLGWSGFGIDGKDLDDISNLEFDGHTLKVWDVDCGYDFNKDGDTMKIVQKHITIENGALKIKNGKTVNNGSGGGQEPICKIKS